MKFLATLILNWNEDGKIYKERLQEKEDAPPPLNLNPWIRGFRLAFVLLFVGFDVGMIIYNKVSKFVLYLVRENLRELGKNSKHKIRACTLANNKCLQRAFSI